MSKISINIASPDFELPDYEGNKVQLAAYRGKSNVLLVFNRGFM
jgi:peroxiredoxin